MLAGRLDSTPASFSEPGALLLRSTVCRRASSTRRAPTLSMSEMMSRMRGWTALKVSKLARLHSSKGLRGAGKNVWLLAPPC